MARYMPGLARVKPDTIKNAANGCVCIAWKRNPLETAAVMILFYMSDALPDAKPTMSKH